MWKKRSMILFSVIIIFSSLFGSRSIVANVKGDYLIEVPLDVENKYVLKTDYPLAYISTQTNEYLGIKDTRIVYRVRYLKPTNNYIVVTKRQLPNGDYFIFTTIRNRSSEQLDVELLVKGIPGSTYSIQPFSQFPIEKKPSPTIGIDPTTYPVGLAEFETDQKRQSFMIGKAYNSRELSLRYPNGSVSQTRELLEEVDPYRLVNGDNGYEMSFSYQAAPNSMAEHWMVVSNTALFESEDFLRDWMKESQVNYRKTNAWYTENGPYNKMVETVEPQPKSMMGYGRSLLLVKEDKALEWFKKTGERYFQDLVYNSLMNLNKFKDGKLFWQTEVTSTYLKDLYGITAPFIDTRFNEQTALFLRNAGETLNIEGLDQAFFDYADLLIEQVEKNNIIPAGKGYFIPDYFAINQDVKTHMSLNHGLGGMNLLLEAYLYSSNQNYLKVAESIRLGFEATEEEWIRPDRDLWYKITPDYKFAGRDYTYLTLEDLLKSYQLWSEVGANNLTIFESFIENKVQYLQDNNYPLTASHKKALEQFGFKY